MFRLIQLTPPKISAQATAPAGANKGDLWIDTAAGNTLHIYDGTTWQPYQWGQLALGAGSVTAAQIAAGTIVAGIVNGTLIEGAQLVADGTSGQVLVYQGAPGPGNLIASISAFSGSDAFGNLIEGGGFVAYGGDMAGLAAGSLNLTSNGHSVGSVEVGPGGGMYLRAPGGFGGLMCDPLAAIDPVNGGRETWHPFTYTAGWSTGPAGLAGQYRLTPDGDVRVIGQVQSASPVSGTVTPFAGLLPGDYRPAHDQHRWALATGSSVPVNIHVAASGQVSLEGLPGGTSIVQFDARVSLDA